MNKKPLLLLLILVCLLCMLTACSGISKEPAANSTEDALMVKAVTAVENKDVDTMKSLCLPEVAEQKGFDGDVEQLFNYYTGHMSAWTRVSRQTSTLTVTKGDKGTTTTVTSVYRITTDDGVYMVTQVRRELPSGDSGLLIFNITSEEEYLNNNPVGYLKDWRSFNFFQWLILLFNIVSYIIIVLALRHCLKNKLRRKFLLAFLILVQGGVGITSSSLGASFNVSVNIFSRSILLVSGNGFWLVFLLPLGAIIYWLIYKRFIKETVAEDIDEQEEKKEEHVGEKETAAENIGDADDE